MKVNASAQVCEFNASLCNSTQVCAIQRKSVQFNASLCNSTQVCAIQRKSVQFNASLCNSTQVCAIQRKSVQFNASLCNSTQVRAISVQAHETQIRSIQAIGVEILVNFASYIYYAVSNWTLKCFWQSFMFTHSSFNFTRFLPCNFKLSNRVFRVSTLHPSSMKPCISVSSLVQFKKCCRKWCPPSFLSNAALPVSPKPLIQTWYKRGVSPLIWNFHIITSYCANISVSIFKNVDLESLRHITGIDNDS